MKWPFNLYSIIGLIYEKQLSKNVSFFLNISCFQCRDWHDAIITLHLRRVHNVIPTLSKRRENESTRFALTQVNSFDVKGMLVPGFEPGSKE